MVQRSTVLVENMCFIGYFGVSLSSWRLKGAASMVSGAAEHHQKTSRRGMGCPGFFQVGISNHAFFFQSFSFRGFYCLHLDSWA